VFIEDEGAGITAATVRNSIIVGRSIYANSLCVRFVGNKSTSTPSSGLSSVGNRVVRKIRVPFIAATRQGRGRDGLPPACGGRKAGLSDACRAVFEQ
jgi:hypothetical protein